MRFTEESAFAGSAVVFEAKRDANYPVEKALAELDAARKNREAVVGVFVMARSHASAVFPLFARHGSNVLVIWDDEDPATDPYLHAAILLGMMLVSRNRAVADAGDIAALRDIEARIEGELARLDAMDKHSEAIRKGVDGLDELIRKGRRALDLLLRKAESTLRALNVETHDEAAERDAPIVVPNLPLEIGLRDEVPDGAISPRGEISSHQPRPETPFGGDRAG